jgi:hypothetical protein
VLPNFGSPLLTFWLSSLFPDRVRDRLRRFPQSVCNFFLGIRNAFLPRFHLTTLPSLPVYLTSPRSHGDYHEKHPHPERIIDTALEESAEGKEDRVISKIEPQLRLTDEDGGEESSSSGGEESQENVQEEEKQPQDGEGESSSSSGGDAEQGGEEKQEEG